MTQGLRILVAHAEDPSSIPSTQMLAHRILTPVTGYLMLFYVLCGHQACTCMWFTCMCVGKAPTFIFKMFQKKQKAAIKGDGENKPLLSSAEGMDQIPVNLLLGAHFLALQRTEGNEKRHQKDVASKVYSEENITGKSSLRQIHCKKRKGLDEDVLNLKGIKVSYRCVQGCMHG